LCVAHGECFTKAAAHVVGRVVMAKGAAPTPRGRSAVAPCWHQHPLNYRHTLQKCHPSFGSASSELRPSWGCCARRPNILREQPIENSRDPGQRTPRPRQVRRSRNNRPQQTSGTRDCLGSEHVEYSPQPRTPPRSPNDGRWSSTFTFTSCVRATCATEMVRMSSLVSVGPILT
jgi:hypothetical protein